MATLPDVTITDTTWVSLNTVTGITVGAAMEIQNKGVAWAYLYLSDTQPADSLRDGVVLTNLADCSATASIPSGAEEVWAKCSYQDRTTKLSVQEG